MSKQRHPTRRVYADAELARPFVSVIVPVFNDAAGIETVLAALAAQSYPRSSYQVIVADNGSTDETPRVVAKHRSLNPDLITLVVEDRVQSSYAARNRGIRAADGRILAFTDADCVPAPDWIEAGVSSLLESGAACGGGRIEFTFRSERPNVFEHFDSARKLKQREYVEDAGFAATANFFARKDLFERRGLFRADLVSGGDFEFGRRVTGQGETLIYVPDAVVRHPARRSFREIYRKSKRVARGQWQLDKLGILQRGRPLLRQLVPVSTVPLDSRWAGSISVLEKLEIVLLLNFVRWLNLFIRVTWRGPRVS